MLSLVVALLMGAASPDSAQEREERHADEVEAALDRIECTTDTECQDALAEELKAYGWTPEEIAEELDK